MAKTRTSFIRNMSKGQVADNTRERFQIMSDLQVIAALARYQAYASNTAQWELDHPDELPPDYVAVSDPDNISMAEKLFVGVRYKATHDDGSRDSEIRSPLCQVNSTNCPGLSAGFLSDLKKVFDARRSRIGYDPA